MVGQIKESMSAVGQVLTVAPERYGEDQGSEESSDLCDENVY